MKDFRGNSKEVLALGTVTLEQFGERYNNMSKSADKLPTASNLIPLTDSNGCTLRNPVDEPMYQAVIFYEIKYPDNRIINKETGKLNLKPVRCTAGAKPKMKVVI